MPIRALTAVVLLASTACWGAEGPVTIALRDVEYGTAQVRTQHVTGSLMGQWSCARIQHTTDRIPMTVGTAFGFRARIDSNQGSRLVLLVSWTLPGAAVVPGWVQQTYLGTIKNHSKVDNCYRLEHPWEMVPGDWKVAVYLVGMDESESVVRAQSSDRHPLLIYQKIFHVYAPE